MLHISFFITTITLHKHYSSRPFSRRFKFTHDSLECNQAYVILSNHRLALDHLHMHDDLRLSQMPNLKRIHCGQARHTTPFIGAQIVSASDTFGIKTCTINVEIALRIACTRDKKMLIISSIVSLGCAKNSLYFIRNRNLGLLAIKVWVNRF